MPETIDAIHYKSSYKLAADQIRRALELGTYLPGDRLPPSREFAVQLGVSVATLREAVRGLIEEGLLEMRRGPKGGLVVLPLPQSRRRHHVSKTALAEMEQALELRRAVEGEAARLAAIRRTDEDLAQLQQAYDAMSREMESPENPLRAARFNRADSEFHSHIARAARNELLQAAIEDARVRMFSAMGVPFRTLAPHVHEGHEAILREIRRGRPDAAAEAARRHVDATHEDALKVV